MNRKDIEKILNGCEGIEDFWGNGIVLKNLHEGLLKEGVSKEELERTDNSITPSSIGSLLAISATAIGAGFMGYLVSNGNFYIAGLAGIAGLSAGFHGSNNALEEKEFDHFCRLYEKYPIQIQKLLKKD